MAKKSKKVEWYLHSRHKLKSTAKKEANRVRKNSNSNARVKKGATTDAWDRGKWLVYTKVKTKRK